MESNEENEHVDTGAYKVMDCLVNHNTVLVNEDFMGTLEGGKKISLLTCIDYIGHVFV